MHFTSIVWIFILVSVPRFVASYSLGAMPVQPFRYVDLDGDGVTEALFLLHGRLSVQNRQGQTLWTTEPFDRPHLLAFEDLDGDGHDEFVFGADGRVYALRGNGQPLWVFETPRDLGGRADCVIAADLLGTGKPQLIVSANGHVYVMDR